MFGSVLGCLTLLVFQAASPPQSKDQEKPAPEAAAPVAPGQALAEYNSLREKTPSTAAAQWKLGLWCEEHGLKPEAYVHFSEVVRLDPRRDAAWRKLGFKKHRGRWATDAQIAEEDEQKKADKVWVPRLKKLHKDVHGRNGAKKQDAAEAALLAITDPRAIISVYREFGGGKIDQTILLQVLNQIDRPISSKILAILAVYGKTPQIRSRAIEILHGRPADDFLDVLVGMMHRSHQVRGEARRRARLARRDLVEGERFNTARFYAPPPAPDIAPGPGDIISFDSSGMPIISRPVMSVPIGGPTGMPGSKFLVEQKTITAYAQISVSQLMAEAQKSAAAAEAQLEADVDQIKSTNTNRKQFNDLVIAAAKDATGKDHGTTPKEWREAVAGANKSSKQPAAPHQSRQSLKRCPWHITQRSRRWGSRP